MEGDLGIRYNAPTIHQLVGEETCQPRLLEIDRSTAGQPMDLKTHAATLSKNVGYLPASETEFNVDAMLAQSATRIAVERHAGTLREEYSVVGAIQVQQGENLLDTENLIGTGGIFKYGRHPEKIFQPPRSTRKNPGSRKPRTPKP